ncbi:hypothetical protein PUN28_018820 [Cardiocondyla obscurior]|uniref:Uncharacterized protein n=1 Tax=Cardiocondyla obscurior TaxID=286306 RepID=A0AAW2EG95_9HYME
MISLNLLKVKWITWIFSAPFKLSRSSGCSEKRHFNNTYKFSYFSELASVCLRPTGVDSPLSLGEILAGLSNGRTHRGLNSGETLASRRTRRPAALFDHYNSEYETRSRSTRAMRTGKKKEKKNKKRITRDKSPKPSLSFEIEKPLARETTITSVSENDRVRLTTINFVFREIRYIRVLETLRTEISRLKLESQMNMLLQSV